MESERKVVELSLAGRLHEVIRQNSIRTIYEALVELVTNADDAYRRVGKTRKDIVIDVLRLTNIKKIKVSVIDQACGMTKDEMVSNLLTVGNYTATSESRGFIGRGCKDCSFLGDIKFTCIKDGKLNQLVIYQNRTAEVLIEDSDVTDQDRAQYEIILDGCNVELLVPNGVVPDIVEFHESLRCNVYLRNIYNDTIVTVREKPALFDRRVQFTYPERKLVVRCDYDVPGYDTVAHLEIYRSKTPMSFPPTADQRQYAINVQSSRSVFENSALYYAGGGKVQDYIFNPSIQCISGTLTCDKIEQLARDAIDGKTTSNNPYLVVDPGRRMGLLKDHPFTAALYQYAYYMLSIIVERVQDTNEEDLLENGNCSDIMNSLSEFVSSMLPPNSVIYAFRTHADHEKLETLTHTIKNVELDNDFLGLTWDQIQKLINDKYVKLDASPITGNTFNITFTTDPTITTPYILLYLPGRVTMKINARDPSIYDFIEVSEKAVNLTNSGKAMTSIGAMVSDATSDLIVRRNIIRETTSVLDINSFNEYQYSYNASRAMVAPGIFSRVLSGINQFKASGTVSSIPLV